MDDVRKAEIAAGGRTGMMALITTGAQVEAAWALTCLAADDAEKAFVAAHGENSDSSIDAWHDGYVAGLSRAPVTDCPHFARGWLDGHREARHPRVAVMPERPEGYYHMPLGTFD